MSVLSLQADKLRKYAERLHQLAVNQGFPARQDMYESAAEMCEAADTIESLRDRLQESYGQVPELGERGNDGERESCGSRWRELFGTPERAALTLGDYCFNMVSCTECGIGCEGKRFEDGDALLEWLKQEVDA